MQTQSSAFSQNVEASNFQADLDIFVAAILNGDEEKAIRSLLKYPINPHLALAIKRVDGMKALQGYNLVDAKKFYPNEF